MEDSLVHPTKKGTPQGDVISPLLSNIYLNIMDMEVEKRGHKFIRYADDFSIYVKTRRSGERVMKSITTFLEKVLCLKVNTEKSEVVHISRMKLLRFGFTMIAGKHVTAPIGRLNKSSNDDSSN
ncbi:hypothetical protein CL176_06710 [Suicoccus acidiformans]|uniref:Reverse transcriptase domain-containing protein n=1 Tax=Suicoccus acidiformans TaxID=2036206 RepID=A0A347WKV7_9LACT|nr:reverse transcriptase domain-containing protein [Suicoccus acidiformans]AXY25714.1 hypothetical protein CL176_06710 [Suicoccus acidiformans]